jgi:hypothetical protein
MVYVYSRTAELVPWVLDGGVTMRGGVAARGDVSVLGGFSTRGGGGTLGGVVARVVPAPSAASVLMVVLLLREVWTLLVALARGV